jgi:hypothetical protein
MGTNPALHKDLKVEANGLSAMAEALVTFLASTDFLGESL